MSVALLVPRTRSGSGPSDAALVVSARGGEMWAKEVLFRRHAPRVNAVALRVMGRDDEVDDLVQDAFVAAFETLARLDDPGRFGSWVAATVVRQACKKIRRRRLLTRLGLRRAETPIDPDAIIGSSAPPDVVVELRRVYGALEAMPADRRVPLVLHRVDGMPLDEIAASMGVSIATVKRRIAEADAMLGKFASK